MPKVKRTRVPASREQILRHMADFPQLERLMPEAAELSPKQLMDRIHAESHLLHQRLVEILETEAEQNNLPNPEYRRGNLLDARDLEAIVNPVNCAGAMGKGLALRFAKRFPAIVPLYTRACREGSLTTSCPQVLEIESDAPRYVVNLATKQHWKNPSRLEWIDSGLDSMYRQLSSLKVTSVGIPPVGAGLGGLPWPAVRETIKKDAGRYSRIRTVIYEPVEQPKGRAGSRARRC